MFIVAGLSWGLLYLWLGQTPAGYIPLTYSLVSSFSIGMFAL